MAKSFRRRFAVAKSRRIIRIERENSGKCHSKIVHFLRLHTFNYCFPCGYGFNPTKKGRRRWNVKLLCPPCFCIVVFVERMESGIRNPECGIRNSFKCHLLEHIVYFYPFFLLAEA